jgi:hypothetical protein
MYKTLGVVAAMVMLPALAMTDAAGAAQKQGPGVHKQTVGEEFSSQRRYRRRVYMRHYWPRYYGYRPRYYGYYGGYGYPYYPYYYAKPYVFGGPFWR